MTGAATPGRSPEAGDTQEGPAFARAAAAADGVPFMSPDQGRRIYEHVREARPELVADIGTAHGVSAAYIAAGLEDNGFGHVISVDSAFAQFSAPAPRELLRGARLDHRVTLDHEFSTYTWWLKEQIRSRSDAAGNCDPTFDFVYLDGAKNWTVDGLAVFLIEKLLRPGGWLLMDDLGWTYSSVKGTRGGNDGVKLTELTEQEIAEPHLRAVFELIVKQHPSFAEFRIEDGWWGWAKKDPSGERHLSLTTTRSLGSFVVDAMRWLQRRLERRL